MITLICGDMQWEVTPKRAQDVLYIQAQMGVKGWELPKDSPYEFKNNALIKRKDTRDRKRKPKPKRDTARESASREAEVPHGDDPE